MGVEELILPVFWKVMDSTPVRELRENLAFFLKIDLRSFLVCEKHLSLRLCLEVHNMDVYVFI